MANKSKILETILISTLGLSLFALSFLAVTKRIESKYAPTKTNTESSEHNPQIYSDQTVRKYIGHPQYMHGGGSQTIYVDRKPFGNLDGKIIRFYNENGNFKDSSETNELSTEDYTEYGKLYERARNYSLHKHLEE